MRWAIKTVSRKTKEPDKLSAMRQSVTIRFKQGYLHSCDACQSALPTRTKLATDSLATARALELFDSPHWGTLQRHEPCPGMQMISWPKHACASWPHRG